MKSLARSLVVVFFVFVIPFPCPLPLERGLGDRTFVGGPVKFLLTRCSFFCCPSFAMPSAAVTRVGRQAGLPALGAVAAWGNAALTVLASGQWRAVRFGVVEFWGWASVACYLTLVEALPVMLRPLHATFR